MDDKGDTQQLRSAKKKADGAGLLGARFPLCFRLGMTVLVEKSTGSPLWGPKSKNRNPF